MNRILFFLMILVLSIITGCTKAASNPPNANINIVSDAEENIEDSDSSEQVIVFSRDEEGKIIPSDDKQIVEINSDSDADADNAAEPEIEEDDFYAKALDDAIKSKITGITYPNTSGMQITYDDLSYVHVLYKDFNNNTCEGEIICNKKVAEDFVDIFKQLYAAEYQIDKIKLIDEYGGDDDISCEQDNTSCFNYRVVDGTTKLSKHSYGTAIDINPMYNPYVKFKDGVAYTKLDCSQPYIDRTQDFPHKIDENDLCYKLFISHGFSWGGSWKNSKDYQHFEKP